MSIVIEREQSSKPRASLRSYILSNKDILYKAKVIINNSTSKAMYSFPMAERFKKYEKDTSSFFYNIPDKFSKRGASIGYGKKSDIRLNRRGKSDNMYNLQTGFDLKHRGGSPKYTFGYGRDICRHNMSKDESKTPGPSSYYPYKKFGESGLHYSMSFRYNNKNGYYNYPGPGTYGYQEFNDKGKYGNSALRNSQQNRFSKTKRFLIFDERFPGPGTYSLEDLTKGDGIVFNSKFFTNNGKTMGIKLKKIKDKLITPGPGSYESFSDFQGFNRYNFFNIRKYNGLKRCKSCVTTRSSKNTSKMKSI